MAPSPTGFLHIGGVRTFLFNWLFARGRAGSASCGSRTPIRAARSPTRSRRSSARSAGSGSSGTARRASSSTAPSGAGSRQRASSPRARPTRTTARSGSACRTKAWSVGRRRQGPDRVSRRRARGHGDPPLRRPPGLQLRLARRRLGRRITHVIRGDDQSRTPEADRRAQALGAELPVYAHVPNVFGEDGKKLSKRHGAVSRRRVPRGRLHRAGADELPRVARLGARRGDDDHVRHRARRAVHARTVGVSPATFDYAKLDWMNGVYLRSSPSRRTPTRS